MWSPGEQDVGGDGPRPDSRPAVPSELERESVVTAIIAAVDDGVVDPREGGRQLSAAYRAATLAELRALAGAVAVDRRVAETARARRARYWALVRIALYALVSAILLVAVLHGVSPTDPH